MFLFASREKINTPGAKTRILVSPLDWGLGHASRCVPLISELLLCQCEVFVAAEGATLALLKKEFRQLNFLPLPGYRVTLSKSRPFFSWKIIIQLPKIMYSVYYERKWLKKTIKQYKINAVISDNRVGLYSRKIFSVYITHQLSIKTGNKLTAAIAQRIHNHYIRRFEECWVPDFEINGLAGELSHPASVPGNVRYIGALSRFRQKKDLERKYDLLIILSGPEPQRSIFEKIILNELQSYEGSTLLIRGLPGNNGIISTAPALVEIINHLAGEALGMAIQQAAIVISRSGYTTVMDLVKLGGKAILVPTPGQAEQEYLARYLKEKNIFFSVEQDDFNLYSSLEKFSRFKSVLPQFNMEQYKITVERLARINTMAASF